MMQDEDTRVLLHTAAENYQAGLPPVAQLLRSGKRAKKRRKLVLAGGTTVAVAAAALGGFAVTPHVGSGALPVVGTTPTHQETSFELDSIAGLTGKDVGDALGLTPWRPQGADIQECHATFAEYHDPPGDSEPAVGFCLAGITDDPVEELVIALQVIGYEQTQTAKAFAAARVEWRNDRHEGAVHWELMRKASELFQQLAAQGTVDPDPGADLAPRK